MNAATVIESMCLSMWSLFLTLDLSISDFDNFACSACLQEQMWFYKFAWEEGLGIRPRAIIIICYMCVSVTKLNAINTSTYQVVTNLTVSRKKM